MKYNFQLFEVVGILVFIASLFLVFLFAEGYHYDIRTSDLVKKGVIYIESIQPKDVQVFLDGMPMIIEQSDEIRVIPGEHLLEIKKGGYKSFQKSIRVPQDKVARVRSVTLVPLVLPGDLYKEDLALFIPPRVQVYGLHQGVVYVNPDLHFASHYLLTSYSPRHVYDLPFHYKKVLPLDAKILVGVDEDGKLFRYEGGVYSFIAANATDITIFDETLFVIEKERTVVRWDDNFTKRTMLFTLPISVGGAWHFEQMQGEGPVAFTTISKNEKIVTVLSDKYELLFQQSGVGAVFLEEDMLYYTEGIRVFRFDIKNNVRQEINSTSIPMKWFSRIQNSIHLLAVTDLGQLFYCNDDFKNCTTLKDHGVAHVISSDDRARFAFILEQNLIVINFERPESFRQLLKDFVASFRSEMKSS